MIPTEKQKEIEKLAERVESGRRRLRELLLKTENLHGRAEFLKRELLGVGYRKKK